MRVVETVVAPGFTAVIVVVSIPFEVAVKPTGPKLVLQLLIAYCRLLDSVDFVPFTNFTVVEFVKPFAVDVVSGVEAEPGRKDHAKVEAFLEAAGVQQPTEAASP